MDTYFHPSTEGKRERGGDLLSHLLELVRSGHNNEFFEKGLRDIVLAEKC